MMAWTSVDVSVTDVQCSLMTLLMAVQLMVRDMRNWQATLKLEHAQTNVGMVLTGEDYVQHVEEMVVDCTLAVRLHVVQEIVGALLNDDYLLSVVASCVSMDLQFVMSVTVLAEPEK
uniref:Uncharacterized protein n=1 Tax=Arion vulgaris TaxID=1028688 RepID=A0A0B7AJA3_9EUPU